MKTLKIWLLLILGMALFISCETEPAEEEDDKDYANKWYRVSDDRTEVYKLEMENDTFVLYEASFDVDTLDTGDYGKDRKGEIEKDGDTIQITVTDFRYDGEWYDEDEYYTLLTDDLAFAAATAQTTVDGVYTENALGYDVTDPDEDTDDDQVLTINAGDDVFSGTYHETVGRSYTYQVSN